MALPITGYNQLLDWKLVYMDGNAGNIAVGASKLAQVGVGGVISAKKKGLPPSSWHDANLIDWKNLQVYIRQNILNKLKPVFWGWTNKQPTVTYFT